MKKTPTITSLFLDIGGVLLTDGWNRQARERAVKNFKLNPAEIEDRHHVTWDTYQLGRLTLEDSFVSSCYVDLLKPDPDIFRLALDVVPAQAEHVIYIENTKLFVEVAEGLGIRSILHADYASTCAKLAAFRLASAESAFHDQG